MDFPIAIPKRYPWVTQCLVIRALFKREIVTRFGKYRLGLFWMLFEPLMSVLVVGLIIGKIAGRAVPEIPYAFFLLNGFLLLKLFTSPMSAGVKAIQANSGLLIYPSVKPLDTLMARFLFDFVTTGFAFCLFCICAVWIGVRPDLSHLDVILCAYLFTWLCGCGFGMVFGVVAAHYSEFEKVVPVIQRPLLFVSAVLFPTNVLPGHVREILLYNPLVHTIESSRHALFPLYKAEGVNLVYPGCIGVIVLAVGLNLFQYKRNELNQV